jgi:hypothetical protein
MRGKKVETGIEQGSRTWFKIAVADAVTVAVIVIADHYRSINFHRLY